jgi:hypothetical protein
VYIGSTESQQATAGIFLGGIGYQGAIGHHTVEVSGIVVVMSGIVEVLFLQVEVINVHADVIEGVDDGLAKRRLFECDFVSHVLIALWLNYF